FFLQKLVPLSGLIEWQKSDYRFQRRSVPVSLIKLLKTTTDYTPFFNLLSPLMLDKERVVHQGLGWFLREAWKKQPVDTENFLLLWKDRSARLIFQYATEKMDKEAKLRFRKEK
ncbi:MAG TPA: DNA alkylation repair protein, partial [Prolixibacteraceae bacterium]|nr:DNA alkylation repair protein [Prolixibacteraceae bacterium]